MVVVVQARVYLGSQLGSLKVVFRFEHVEGFDFLRHVQVLSQMFEDFLDHRERLLTDQELMGL